MGKRQKAELDLKLWSIQCRGGAVGSSPSNRVETGLEKLTAYHRTMYVVLVLTVVPREQKRTDQHRECRHEFRRLGFLRVFTTAGVPT